MKIVLASLLFSSTAAFAPAASHRTVSSLRAASVEDDAAPVAEEPAAPSAYNARVDARQFDSLFGVSIETGNRCPPIGANILGDMTDEGILWYQNAEIKHGRIAMVATIGFMAQKFGVHFPLYLGPSGSNAFNPESTASWFLSSSSGLTFSDVAKAAPLDAVTMVPLNGWLQIFAVAGIAEGAAWEYWKNSDKKIPGNFGYDPLGFTQREGGFDSAELASLRMKEIKNGRVAMMAIAGWVANEAIPGALPVWHP